jgi:hypothetical protein
MRTTVEWTRLGHGLAGWSVIVLLPGWLAVLPAHVAVHACRPCVPPQLPTCTADRRERQYEASGDGTMYFFRLDSQQVIDATRKVCVVPACLRPCLCLGLVAWLLGLVSGTRNRWSCLAGRGPVSTHQPLLLRFAFAHCLCSLPACLLACLPAPVCVRACVQGNTARHINHSCAPNCFTRVMLDMHTRELAVLTVACVGLGFGLREVGWVQRWRVVLLGWLWTMCKARAASRWLFACWLSMQCAVQCCWTAQGVLEAS